MDAILPLRETLFINTECFLEFSEGGSAMSLSAKQTLFASALLFAALPLAAEEHAAAAGVAAAPRAYVNCPGISSVPMTADAEQALPLRQTGTLSCGEPVAILDDTEGYTAHIRTADGKDGFVARMYLTAAASHADSHPAAASAAPIGTAHPVNGVVRWRANDPGCDHFQSNGRLVESITANGITVQVSLQDTGWKLRATVAVSNQTSEQLYVLPALLTLDELQPGIRNLRSIDPGKLAHSEANHQVLRTEATAGPSPSAITLRPASYRNAPTTDFIGNRAEEGSVQSLALRTVNLSPGQKTAGVVWFARDPAARELSMRFSVGDLIFDFPFSFNDKK